jgi:prophage regulatory protein
MRWRSDEGSQPIHDNKQVIFIVDRTDLSRGTVYQWIGEGCFPKPVSLGARAVGWVETDVEEWISRQIESSRPARSGDSAPPLWSEFKLGDA